MALRALSKQDAEPADDETLVLAARGGDPAAQETLVRKYGLMVNGLGFRLLGGSEDLDDLVQDSFLRAFRSLKSLRRPAGFKRWLSEIVVRTAYNVIRHRRMLARLGLRTAKPADLEELIAPGAPPDATLALVAIHRNLEKLPTKIRIALVLRRVEGRQLEEVAQLMGASLASVKRWVARADAVLEEEVGNLKGRNDEGGRDEGGGDDAT